MSLDSDNLLNLNKFNCNQKKEGIKSNYICRICLGDEHEGSNPLVNFCKCSGTMKFVHFDCLKQWLNSKKHKFELKPFIFVLKFKKVECEVCKTNISDKILLKNEVVNLLELEHPSTDYIILELFRANSVNKTFYIIHHKAQQQYRIGRAENCDLKMNDSTVSNYHANLSIKDSFIYIEDLNSKYGTLILAETDFLLIPNKTFSLQVNGILVNFTCKKDDNIIKKCFDLFCKRRDYIQEYMNNYKDYNDNPLSKQLSQIEKIEFPLLKMMCYDEFIERENSPFNVMTSTIKPLTKYSTLENSNNFLFCIKKKIKNLEKDLFEGKTNNVDLSSEESSYISRVPSTTRLRLRTRNFLNLTTEKFIPFQPRSKLSSNNLDYRNCINSERHQQTNSNPQRFEMETLNLEKMQFDKLEKLENLFIKSKYGLLNRPSLNNNNSVKEENKQNLN